MLFSIRYGMTGKSRECEAQICYRTGTLVSGYWLDDDSEMTDEDLLMVEEAFEYELREEAIGYRAEEAYDRWKDGE